MRGSIRVLLDCVFVAWDVPALRVLSVIREGARSLPMITADLGNEIAAELRRDGPLKGIAAQRPSIRARPQRAPRCWVSLADRPRLG